MQTCKKFKSRLALYVSEELPARQTERIAAHLAQCPSCRAEVEAYRQLTQHLRVLPNPTIPEHAVHDFSRTVMAQIAPPARNGGRAWDFWAQLFRPRWRYAWATAGIVGFMLVLGLWYAPYEREHQAALQLPQLLQARAWDKLYHGLLHEETRALLLRERVPAQLLKTALAELLQKGKRDHHWRAGMRRLVAAVADQKSERYVDSGSAKIMGVITARGYVPTPRTRRQEFDHEQLLREVQKLPDGADVTLAELVNPKD